MVIEMNGVIGPGDMTAINEAHDARLFAEGCLFVLCFTGNVTGMAPAARHEHKVRPKDPPPSFSAILGARFVARVIIDMMVRAANLLTNAQVTHRFFDEEAEARAWL